MEIVFLGTGTGIPSLQRSSPAVLLRQGNKTILVDSGAGTLRQLTRINLSFNQLDYLFFTHLHPDHTGDLVPYLFASRNRTAFKRNAPVQIIGPKGLLKLYENLHEAFGHSIEPPEEIVSISELPFGKNKLSLSGLEISTFPTLHTTESQGYLFKADSGQAVAITGDTGYSPELVENVKGVDLLITECSFPDSEKVEGHLTPTMAARLASEAGVRAMALNHFYPEIEGHDIITPIKMIFKGLLYLTEDLQKISP